MRPLLILLALPCAVSIAHPVGMRSSSRPRITPIAPAVASSEPDSSLEEVRAHVAELRRLRAKAKQHALRLSKASCETADSFYSEMQDYGEQLAALDDIQRALVRSAKAGMLREQRAAQKKWQAWLNTRRRVSSQ